MTDGDTLKQGGVTYRLWGIDSDYVAQQEEAKADRLGVHQHGCLPAWEWRAQQRAGNQQRTE